MNKNSFAKVPPMGWNSYDYYDTTVNEEQIKANADYMAAHMKDYGWEYVVVDIQWYARKAGSQRDKFQYIPFSDLEMDEYSRLIPDPERFPSSADGKGFGPLADYVHSLGLKFGIHIMRGIPRIAAQQHTKIKNCSVTADIAANPSSICYWNPDMYGLNNTPEGQAYYDSLMELYASWGVDFVKCDDICNTDNQSPYRDRQYASAHEIEMLAEAINRCGRPIVLSLSPGPALIDRAWHYEKYSNMWRITDDYWDDWRYLKDMFTRCELWQNHVSEGCYPDCDMLPLGWIGKGFGQERMTKFTKEEQRTMMTLWCLFGSPLMLGAELTKMDDWTLSLLTNKKILALLPPYCRPRQICRDENKAVWTVRNEKDGTFCTALFNLSDKEAEVCAPLEELELETKDDISLLDLWKDTAASSKEGKICAKLPAHGCVIYQIQ